MLDFLYLALGLAFFALMALYASASERIQEGIMGPLLGLAVALALGFYLLITLLYPEKF